MELLDNPLVFWGLIGGAGLLLASPSVASLQVVAANALAKVRSLVPGTTTAVPTSQDTEDALDFAAFSRLRKRAETRGATASIDHLNGLLPVLFGPVVAPLPPAPLKAGVT